MTSNSIFSKSEQSRMDRIGQLLARAIGKKCRKEELEKARQQQPDLPDDASPVLVFISQIGEVSPQEAKAHFSLSPVMLLR